MDEEVVWERHVGKAWQLVLYRRTRHDKPLCFYI
jgi:hypothetical protein